MKYLVLIIIVVLTLLLMAGCAQTGFTMKNRIVCTVGRDKAFVVSEYGGWVGVSTAIAEDDLPYICPAGVMLDVK